MINSICLVRLSALGDVLMYVPLVRTLQKHLPNASLTWIISRPAYELVEHMPGVEFIVIEKPSGIADLWRFKKQLKHRCFDVLLASQASFRANLLYPCIRARCKIGYDAHRANDGHGWFVNERIAPGADHTLEGFLKFAQAIGITEPDVRWDLPLDDADCEWARQQLSQSAPVLLVNPAASKPERTWLVERYIEVMVQAQKQWGVQIVLTGGPSNFDKHMALQIIEQVPHALNLVGQTKPRQLLALIQQAQVVLCPDTGPAHMACAMNTPVIALHAVTNPYISGPYRFLPLAVNRYPQAVSQLLGRSPGDIPWGTQVHDPRAMALISVHDVMEHLGRVLVK